MSLSYLEAPRGRRPLQFPIASVSHGKRERERESSFVVKSTASRSFVLSSAKEEEEE